MDAMTEMAGLLRRTYPTIDEYHAYHSTPGKLSTTVPHVGNRSFVDIEVKRSCTETDERSDVTSGVCCIIGGNIGLESNLDVELRADIAGRNS